MKKFKRKSVKTLSVYICDKCGMQANFGDINSLEVHEFISIEHVCGYHSIFYDGATATIDLCQHCFKETLGAWVSLKPR
jgi:hypothetical protein